MTLISSLIVRIFYREDLCVMRQFAIVMNVLISHPEFVNRLKISTIQIDYLRGTSSELSQHRKQVELYSDPVLRVEVGVNTEIHFGDRKDYCEIQSSQSILGAIQSMSANY